MTQPGRRSAASLAQYPIARNPPPSPPENLPEEAKGIWRKIVAGFRSDWFQGGSEFLLEIHCQDVVIGRQIADTLRKTSIDSETDRYVELLRLYLQVAGNMAAIATKLRLTPQSSRDSRHTKLVPPGPYPWERDSDEAEPPLAVVPDDSDGNERDFGVLLQQRRARRGRAMLATETLDMAAFLGGTTARS